MQDHSEELISKKELLQSTGISYGQLYRWKRQNLIPEAWFIKQSSFTGQETFFPRDKILKRVKMITELKDQYSLEELADLFSPSTTNRVFSSQQLATLPGFSREVVKHFAERLQKSEFGFREVLFIYLLSQLEQHQVFDEQELGGVIDSVGHWLPKLRNLGYVFVVCRREKRSFGMLIQQQAVFHLDQQTQQMGVYDLDELAKDLNLKLNKVLEES